MYISAHAKEFGDGGVAETSVDALNTYSWLAAESSHGPLVRTTGEGGWTGDLNSLGPSVMLVG
jgi:hypothetical protein